MLMTSSSRAQLDDSDHVIDLMKTGTVLEAWTDALSTTTLNCMTIGQLVF
jgi:hypothetical protein